MKTKLKILHLEDMPADAELVERVLKKEKIEFEKLVVDNKKDYEKALQEFDPDIIISDHTLPFFNSFEAIKIAKQNGIKAPIILVSSTVSDDFAVEIMKAGADDYILKDRLHRLPKAIQNAMKKIRVDKKLHASETFNKAVLSSLSSHITVINKSGTLISVNKAWNDFGYKNKVSSLKSISAGSNYFDACNRAIKEGDYYSIKALAGIKSVLEKELKYFEMEYPCHSPDKQQWFLLNVVNFGGDTDQVVISHKNVTLRKQVQLELLLHQSNLIALIENTDAMIYSLDLQLEYITFNQQLLKTLKQNYNLDIKIGDHINRFLENLSPKEANQWRHRFKSVIAGETMKFEKESTLGGRYNCSSFSMNPIWENKTVIGLTCFVGDITQQKLEQKEKEKISIDLIQRNRDLEQFTFIISHNLRAPAANIIACSEYLQDETITGPEREEFLEGLSKSITTLDNVIKDINNILRVKSEINEKKEVIIFSKIVKDIKTSIGYLIAKHHVRIITDFAEVDEIYSIKVYIYSIFYNLLNNSIKYGKPNDPPRIEIKSKKEDGKIILTFKDNGLGIDLKTQGDKIFRLYRRFHAHVEGKGIGLYMVKTQIESLGGNIAIASELHKGTEFTIVLKD